MRGKIREWIVDSPRAMDAAYVLVAASAVAVQVGTQEATGATSGP